MVSQEGRVQVSQNVVVYPVSSFIFSDAIHFGTTDEGGGLYIWLVKVASQAGGGRSTSMTWLIL